MFGQVVVVETVFGQEEAWFQDVDLFEVPSLRLDVGIWSYSLGPGI